MNESTDGSCERELKKVTGSLFSLGFYTTFESISILTICPGDLREFDRFSVRFFFYCYSVSLSSNRLISETSAAKLFPGFFILLNLNRIVS